MTTVLLNWIYLLRFWPTQYTSHFSKHHIPFPFLVSIKTNSFIAPIYFLLYNSSITHFDNCRHLFFENYAIFSITSYSNNLVSLIWQPKFITMPSNRKKSSSKKTIQASDRDHDRDHTPRRENIYDHDDIHLLQNKVLINLVPSLKMLNQLIHLYFQKNVL